MTSPSSYIEKRLPAPRVKAMSILTSTRTQADGSHDEWTLLHLSSAEGPVYRRIKTSPLRDARADEIPVIDLSFMRSSSLAARQELATRIRQAATTSGFFYIKNHGIPLPVIEAAYQASLEFFRQPEQIKERVNGEQTPSLNGWKPANTQQINIAESIDVREKFSFRYDARYDPQVSGNLGKIPGDLAKDVIGTDWCWEQTSNLPHFKDAIISYWRETLSLARALVQSFALALDLPETFFDEKVMYPDAGVGLNYYPTIPPVTGEESLEQVSIGSHTDFQLFTILWQDAVGGLQIVNPEGEWINAPPIAGTFVVNIADYAQRITNGRWKSTVHRAQNGSGRERVSMPLFFGFGLDQSCGVLGSCVGEGEERKYEEIGCKEWVEKRVRAMHMEE